MNSVSPVLFLRCKIINPWGASTVTSLSEHRVTKRSAVLSSVMEQNFLTVSPLSLVCYPSTVLRTTHLPNFCDHTLTVFNGGRSCGKIKIISLIDNVKTSLKEQLVKWDLKLLFWHSGLTFVCSYIFNYN